ncbi:hypothetical protein EPO33_01605 [Patescibacteria group bacterium]|nr:MAG: hypothetical protein EPO33_01605 [Patescibacteria group bacterium]
MQTKARKSILFGWRANLRILSTAFANSLAYRTDLFFYRVFDLVEPLALLLMWSALFATNEQLVGYTKAEMLTYVLASRLADTVAISWVHEDVATSIREGRITQFLLKPISHVRYVFWDALGHSVQAKTMSLLVTVGLMALFHAHMIIGSPARAAVALLLALGAFMINVLFSVSYGYAAFWLGRINGFVQSFYIIRWMFNGLAFPLDILGQGFRTVSLALPFAYSAFVPAQVYLGRMDMTQAFHAALVEGVWILVLLALTRVLWHFGVRRYEGVGI